jgi:hypothetical protein
MLAGRDGNFAMRQARGAKRVITEHNIRPRRFDEHENAVRLAPDILTGLCPEIAIETIDAAGESAPVVMWRKRLDSQIRPRRSHP